MQKYITWCPMFPGFYNTNFEPCFEYGEIENYNAENNLALTYENFEFDYVEYETRMAKTYVSHIETAMKRILPIDMKFNHVYSPKEYNFDNDQIIVEVQVDLDLLIFFIKSIYKKAAKHFKEYYSDQPGLYSIHSGEIDRWLQPAYILESDFFRVGALLHCLASLEIDPYEIESLCDNEFYLEYTIKTT